MGCTPLKICSTHYSTNASALAPNPNPSRWTLLEKFEYPNGYVLKVKYHDCTNFEGVKIMVYAGKYSPRNSLDPHFYDGKDAPIARFRPDKNGIKMARELAKNL